LLSFSPITCPENTDHVAAIHESDSKHAIFDKAETVMPRLIRTVRKIFGYHALRVCESELRQAEANAVLILIFLVLLRIPLEPGLCHEGRLA